MELVTARNTLSDSGARYNYDKMLSLQVGSRSKKEFVCLLFLFLKSKKKKKTKGPLTLSREPPQFGIKHYPNGDCALYLVSLLVRFEKTLN